MKSKIKVLFPITDLSRDGAQRQLLELVKGLDKRRFKPIVLTMHSGGAMEAEFKEIPEAQVISLEKNGKYDFFYPMKVAQLMKRLKADVVQPFLTPATFYGLFPAILCHTPVKIVTERNSQKKTKSRLGNRLYIKAEDTLTHFADWAVSNSQAGKDYLIERGIDPARTKVIYNGLDLQRLQYDSARAQQVKEKLAITPGAKLVGMMARMFPQKRYDIFLQAASIVSRALPETRFALVGDGPMRGSLETLCRELGLTGKATFFGEQQDVGTYLSIFDVAVLTSESEGCSNSLLEAMALGKPVVANDVGGNRELVQPGQTGLLVPYGSAEAVAGAILSLLRDTGAATAMGQRAQKDIIGKFSPENMVTQYQVLYEETLKQKGEKT